MITYSVKRSDASGNRIYPLIHEDEITREDIDYAVFIMNDWTEGQFDILSYFDAPIFSEEQRILDSAVDAASIALQFGIKSLTLTGRQTARRLIREHNALIEAAFAKKGKASSTTVYQDTSLAAKNAGYVYLLQSPTSAYKIGRTKDPDNRIKTFNVKLPFEVNFIALIRTSDMYSLESELHDQFADKHINGEWFNLTADDVEYVKSLIGGEQ